MAHPRGKQYSNKNNDKRRLTGTLSLSLFRAVPVLMANLDKLSPGAKENPGAAGTVPGLVIKSSDAIECKTLRLNWGAAQ
jgi:hypothetical protein